MSMWCVVQDEGGIMSLADVYCRFNRARGMEVSSTERAQLARMVIATAWKEVVRSIFV